MIDYFCQTTKSMRSKLHEEAAVDRTASAFALEHIQFQQGLPMYARKEEFLSQLQSAQCIVLVGGTGIGELHKTFGVLRTRLF